ncbi:MAG: hypothetical protein HY867_06230 [Chloroflexi bacterium]|nr:hypothetical protein [Chloroflexota bacterium]
MKTAKGQDYSTMLIWASALVGMIRYAAAFLASDVGMIAGVTSEIVTVMLGVSGFFMGILSTFGTAYLFDGWRKKMPASGQKWPFKFSALTGFVGMAFVCELLILVPFTVSRMEHASMTDILQGGVWWWSTAVNIMPILLIGGASVGHQIVTVSSQGDAESFRQVSADGGKLSDKFPKGWRKVRKQLTEDQVRSIAVDQTKNIAFHFQVDDRTARNWRKYAQEELAKAEKQA